MGTTTPNIGLYIPADGETNYGTAFANGMLNLDTHDHSGAPNKGVPLSATGLANGSVTAPKLNANVLSPGGGLTFDVNNAIQADLLLKAINGIGSNGLIARTSGSTAAARTLVSSTPSIISITAGDGVSGNPTFEVPTTFFQEGNWTPGLKGSITPGTLTYTAPGLQYGTFQRIGSWVDCYGYVKVNAVSVAMSGDLQITGLPFTSDNTSLSIYMGIVDPAAQSATTPTTPGGTFPFLRVNQGTTDMTLLFYNPTSGGDNTYDSSVWSAGDDLAIRIRYKIA